jgi:hypothetical protein
VLSIIEEYQYLDKNFSISFDNASNCNATIRLLTNTLKPIMDGAFFHTKYACHILNLIVKAGMEVDPIQNLIGTTRQTRHALSMPCLILSFLDTIWHDTKKNKIIKDTVRKHGVPEHDTIRHGTNLEHYRWHVISGRSHLNP